MAVQVNISEAKANLSRLLEQVLQGERVVIAKSGKPIVDLIRHQGSTVQFGTLKDQIVYDEDEFNSADAEIAAMFDFDVDVDAAP